VIGYLDIKVKIDKLTMIIRKISHLQSGDRRWFNLPTFCREKADGTPNYLKYWQFELEVHNGQLMEALSDKVKEYCQLHNIEEIQPLSFESSAVTFESFAEVIFLKDGPLLSFGDSH